MLKRQGDKMGLPVAYKRPLKPEIYIFMKISQMSRETTVWLECILAWKQHKGARSGPRRKHLNRCTLMEYHEPALAFLHPN